jgi:hypothetical protein
MIDVELITHGAKAKIFAKIASKADVEKFRGMVFDGFTVQAPYVASTPEREAIYSYMWSVLTDCVMRSYRPNPAVAEWPKAWHEPICECGVDKTGVGGLHSDWCPKH